MRVGTRLKILIQSDSARFAAEVAELLSTTRYAETGTPDPSCSFVQDCLIVEGRTVTWDRMEKYAKAKDMLVLMLGGMSQKGEEPHRVFSAPFPIAAEAIECLLDQMSLSAWRIAGKPEKRAHDRYAFSVPLGGGWKLVDISEGGCQIETPVSVSPGALCSVVLDRVFPELMNPFNVRVARVREAPAPGRFRLHGSFMLPSERARRELSSRLADLAV